LLLFWGDGFAATAHPSHRFGVIGDSLALGTNTNDSCLDQDIIDCLSPDGGGLRRMMGQEAEWTAAAGGQSFSIPYRLGYAPWQVLNAAWNGAEWNDAYTQAQNIIAWAGGGADVKHVLIHLGHNNVCIGDGQHYPDIAVVAAQMDQTLTYLTDNLAPGAFIGISDIVDIVGMRNRMMNVDHPYLTANCQGIWDVNIDQFKESVIDEACVHYFGRTGWLCDKGFVKSVIQFLIDNYTRTNPSVCGKVLASWSTQADRDQAFWFNIALNDKLREKAAQYNGRNGVTVVFSEQQFRQSIEPFMLSKLDCFHASRWGQAQMGLQMWKGFDPGNTDVMRVFRDEWNAVSYGNNDGLNGNFSSDWLEYNDDGAPGSGAVRQRWVYDSPGWTGQLFIGEWWNGVFRYFDGDWAPNAWVTYNYKRENLRSGEYARVGVFRHGGSAWEEWLIWGTRDEDWSLQRGDFVDVSSRSAPAFAIHVGMGHGSASWRGISFDEIQIVTWSDNHPPTCGCQSRGDLKPPGDHFDNFCFYGPRTPGCGMTFPGGYCDPNGDGNYSDGDWIRGWTEYHAQCAQ
jgi:hypothetical protein